MKIAAFKKTYGDRTVLDFPGAYLEEGKVYAIIGANGSGKSTFAKILAGVEKPDSIKYPAEKVTIGYMPQKSFAFRMSLKRNLILNSKNTDRAEDLMKAFGLSHLSDKSAKRLSGGETAKMALARLMMQDYSMLVLDEPTAAMDMESTLLAEAMIKRYCKDKHSTVVLITHSLQQAERISDRILFFSDGCIRESGETKDVLGSPSFEETAKFIEFYGLNREEKG